METPNTSHVNFVMTIPDSHFYTDLQQIKTSLEYMVAGMPTITPEYMLTGIKNTIVNGYTMAPPAAKLAKHDYVIFMKGRSKRPIFGQIRVITKTGIYHVKRQDTGMVERITDPSILTKWSPKI